MKRCLMAFLLFATVSSSAWADVLTFDNISNPNEYTTLPIPGNYGGFTWSDNIYLMTQGYYQQNYGNTYGYPSASNAAFNTGGSLSVTVAGGSTFNFNGAYFTGWAYYNSLESFTSRSITVNGYSGTTLIGTVTVTLPTDSFVWVNANFSGVDRVDFLNDGNDMRWWVMDNFTFNESISTPEPSSLLLLTTGLGGIALAAYRRKKS